MTKKSLLIFNVVMFFLVEFIYLVLIQLFMTVVKFKLNLTNTIVMADIKNTCLHPIMTALRLIDGRNPLYILGSVLLAIYFIYLTLKQVHKTSSDWENSKKGTHGTARWGAFKELIKDGNYKYISERNFFSEWKKTGNWEKRDNE
ncbi:hypothetical protein [Streptococcus parauberis]|uniref:hypothetical protein n=1 Tax=Streptococcus parauberis TaxID=1348 RepID=UPI0039B0A1C4